MVALHTHPKIAATSNDGVQSEDKIRQNLADYIAHQNKYGYSQWAIFDKADSKFMGRGGLTFCAQTSEHPEKPTLRIALLPDYWHAGYAQECCEGVMQHAFQCFEIEQIVAGALNNNPRARRLIENLKFDYQGQANWPAMEGAYFIITREQFVRSNQ